MPKKWAALAVLAVLPLAAPAWADPAQPPIVFPSGFPFPNGFHLPNGSPFPGGFPFPDPFPNPIPVLNPPPHIDPLPPLPWPFPGPLPGPTPGPFHGAPAPLLAAGIPAFLALGAGGALARLLRRRRPGTAATAGGADGLDV